MSETKHITQENLSRAKVLARRHHETLWLGSRFLDADARRRVEALLALDGEFLRISTSVSEPTMGQIRYQWWLDQLDGYQEDPTKPLSGDTFLLAIAFEGLDDRMFEAGRRWIESRERLFLSELSSAESYEALFTLLNGLLVGTPSDTDNLSIQQAHVYAAIDGAGLHSDHLLGLANELAKISDAHWPIASVFVAARDWTQRKSRSPLGRRLQILRSFLQGEAALANRLCKLASEMPL